MLRNLSGFDFDIVEWMQHAQAQIVSPKSAKIASKHRNFDEKIEDRLLREGTIITQKRQNMIANNDYEINKAASASY